MRSTPRLMASSCCELCSFRHGLGSAEHRVDTFATPHHPLYISPLAGLYWCFRFSLMHRSFSESPGELYFVRSSEP